MKVILLAAGRGTRISREIHEAPKCSLPIGDMSLIQHTVKLFLKNDISVCIALGFKHKVLEEQLAAYPIEMVYNPFYDVTNSIASFWFAKEFWKEGEDILIMNADVYIEQDTIDLLVGEKRCPMMLADRKRIVEGDFFFKDDNDVLKEYGKELKLEDRTAEYIGIAKLEARHRDKIMKKMGEMISVQKHGDWWENILYALSDEGENIYVRNIGDLFWSEIDYIEDYQRILSYVARTHKEL